MVSSEGVNAKSTLRAQMFSLPDPLLSLCACLISRAHHWINPKQQEILTALQRGSHGPLHLKRRAAMILLAAQGFPNQQIARTYEWAGTR